MFAENVQGRATVYPGHPTPPLYGLTSEEVRARSRQDGAPAPG